MKALFEKWLSYSQQLTLLYVEDNDDARMGGLFILEELFGNVIVAHDGEEGLQKFKDNTIDIVMTDVNMPKMNGLEMVNAIRLLNAQTPILIVSAYNESGYFIESIRHGVDGYLLKPIDMKQLLETLGRVIEKLILKKDRDKLQDLLMQYTDVTDKSAIVCKTDTKGVITYVNDEFCAIAGFQREELVGKRHSKVRHSEMSEEFFKQMWETITKGELWQGVIKNRSKKGGSYYVKAAIKPILNDHGEITEYIALCNDITGVMNPKKQLFDYINATEEAIVVLFKMEDFTTLEEFYSDGVIDYLERILGEEIFKTLPNTCGFKKIYTLGGGEYALAMHKIKCTLSLEALSQMLSYFIASMEGFVIHAGEIEYSVSLIGSLAFGGNEPFQSAQFGIKKAEKEKIDFVLATNFVSDMHLQAQHNMSIIVAVKKALQKSGIISYFQPIVDNKTKQVVKYESLVRLVNEYGEVWAPWKFLEIAKKGRYYTQITQRVVENSFKALYETQAGITINLSALDIEEHTMREHLLELVKEHASRAHRITFELLEDENVKEFEIIKRFIQHVKAMGVSIAIDDFGSGYSNFERLLDYEPDIIKIDGSLVKNIATDDYSISIVKLVVNFAKEHGIKTVAEFVENETIYNILYDLGVDYSQGYYFGKPEPLPKK